MVKIVQLKKRAKKKGLCPLSVSNQDRKLNRKWFTVAEAFKKSHCITTKGVFKKIIHQCKEMMKEEMRITL